MFPLASGVYHWPAKLDAGSTGVDTTPPGEATMAITLDDMLREFNEKNITWRFCKAVASIVPACPELEYYKNLQQAADLPRGRHTQGSRDSCRA